MVQNGPVSGKITFAQRERARRGRRAVSCEISSRWLRFGDPSDVGFGEGDLVDLEVLTDVYDDGVAHAPPRTRRLARMMVRVEELRAILEQFDEERQGGIGA